MSKSPKIMPMNDLPLNTFFFFFSIMCIIGNVPMYTLPTDENTGRNPPIT